MTNELRREAIACSPLRTLPRKRVTARRNVSGVLFLSVAGITSSELSMAIDTRPLRIESRLWRPWHDNLRRNRCHAGYLSRASQNVGRHSAQDAPTRWYMPLLGASLVQASAYGSRQQDFDKVILQPFTERASEFDAPILRLFVGDAGRGIKAAPVYSHLSEAEAVAETILAALDYHPPASQQTTGPRGLWMVKELVRSFHGSVITSSGKAVAGYVFGPNERKVNPKSSYSLPGTIVECNLLVGAGREAEPQADSGSAYPSLTEKTPANLKCAAALLRNGTESIPLISRKLERRLNRPRIPILLGL